MKLALFDIDGTLVKVFNNHRETFKQAFEEITGIEYDLSKWAYSGYTDLQIIHKFLDDHDVKKTPELTDKIVKRMIEIFQEKDISDSIMIPGVKKLLEELSKKDDVIIGLLTGNIEEIAYTKLKHFGIEEYFLFGGFGHRSAIRAELVDFALEEAKKHHKELIDRKDVILIGDTTRDIDAAKQSKTKVIAVSTGRFTMEQLKEKNPDFLFNGLEETDKIIEAIYHE